jgi:hypothetical protein
MAPWRHELPKETHKGVLRARRSISLYNFYPPFAQVCEGAVFVLFCTILLMRQLYSIALIP